LGWNEILEGTGEDGMGVLRGWVGWKRNCTGTSRDGYHISGMVVMGVISVSVQVSNVNSVQLLLVAFTLVTRKGTVNYRAVLSVLKLTSCVAQFNHHYSHFLYKIWEYNKPQSVALQTIEKDRAYIYC